MSREPAVALVALRVVKDMLTVADSQLRSQVEAGMLVGDRTTAALEDGTVVGHVQRKKGSAGGRVTAAVTDEGALLRWARQHAQHLVTEHVSLPSQRALLEIVKTEGGWPDPDTGEVLPVPGIDMSVSPDGKPSLEVRPTPDAAEIIRQAWADGRLTLASIVPELTA